MTEPKPTTRASKILTRASIRPMVSASRSSSNYQASLSLLVDQQKRQGDAVNALSYTISVGYAIIAIVYLVLAFGIPGASNDKMAVAFICLITIFAVFMNYQLINAIHAQRLIDKTVFRSLSEESTAIQKIVFDRFAENRQTTERYLIFSSLVYFKMAEFAVWSGFITMSSIFIGR